MPTEHSRLSASSAYRWIRCPGSLAGEAHDDEPSEASREGTLAHDLAEEWLLLGYKPDFPDDDMEEAVSEYVEYVTGQPDRFELFVEQRIVSEDEPDFGGTIDALLVSDTEIHVVDFKYGRKPVVAEGNDQLRSYLCLAQERFPGRSFFAGSIIQPRVSRPQYAEFTDDELLDHMMAVLDAAAKDYRKAGAHCIYCPLLARCEEAHQYNLDLAKIQFSERLDVDRCLEILEAESAFSNLVDKVKRHLLTLCINGEEVPGYRAGMSRTNRQWKDEQEAESALLQAGMSSLQVWEQKLKSPAQVEKSRLVPKALVAELAERKDKGPVLVPLTSRLPEYKLEDVFTPVESEDL